MILMNIPELIAWVLLYTATSVNMLYTAAFMMGMSAGFMEAPGLAYIGEITEPRVRGPLTSFANINVSVGLLIEFLLGSIVDWRTAVAISAVFPILSIVMIAFVSVHMRIIIFLTEQYGRTGRIIYDTFVKNCVRTSNKKLETTPYIIVRDIMLYLIESHAKRRTL